MPNTKDIEVANIRLKVLVYGTSGSGKTTFAGTFPKPYFFDTDFGMLTLRGRDIEYDSYDSWVEMKSKLDKMLAKETEFETIVIDSITSVQDLMLAAIMAENNQKEPRLHEWGVLVERLRGLFFKLKRDRRYHVVVTAHEELVKDEESGGIMFQPLIVGKKMPQQMPAFSDEVYRARVRKAGKHYKYIVATNAGVNFMAKSRLGCLDREEIPDFNVIRAKIQEGAVPSVVEEDEEETPVGEQEDGKD